MTSYMLAFRNARQTKNRLKQNNQIFKTFKPTFQNRCLVLSQNQQKNQML